MVYYFCLLIALFLTNRQTFCSNAENDSGFILLTFLYSETRPERINEYKECLTLNLKNKHIKKIHVIFDTEKIEQSNDLLSFLQEKPIEITFLKERPSFGYCFNLVNERYKNSTLLLSNSDIYFNETVALVKNINLTNTFIGLTRWDRKKNGELVLHHTPYSQDVWIFKSPLLFSGLSHYQLGSPGCDNFIAKQAVESGLSVINPCLSIQACHIHESGIRNYVENEALTDFMFEMADMPIEWSALEY
jgi:hypothetical protein